MRRLLLGTLICLTFLLSGDAAGKDYGEGIDRFVKLGLPDVSGMRYMKISGDSYDLAIHPLLSDNYGSIGNAWLVGETRNDAGEVIKGTFVVNDSRIIDLLNIDRIPLSDRRRLSSSTASWAPAPLETDIGRTLRFLRRKKNAGEKLHSPGRLVFFAFHLYQQGKKAEANEILHAVYQLSESPKQALVRALCDLGDARYRAAIDQFRNETNWKALADELKTILSAFKLKWKSRPAIELLLKRVQRKLDGTDTFENELALLSAEMRELAVALKKTRKLRYFSEAPTAVWLLPETWLPLFPRYRDDPNLRVRSLGIHAIPLLVLLREDRNTLTTCCSDSRDYYFDYGFGGPGRQTPEEILHRLPHPLTRGELAHAILRDMFPEQNDGLASAAKEFHAAHSKRPSSEIAAQLLLHGQNYSQQKATRDLVLISALERPNTVIEDWVHRQGKKEKKGMFLARDSGNVYALSTQDQAKIVIDYVEARGKTALPLAMAMADILDRAAKHYRIPANYGFENKKQEQEYIDRKRLQLRNVAVELRRLKDSAGDLAGRIDAQLSGREMNGPSAMLRISPPGKVIELVLGKAVASQSQLTRDRALNLLCNLECSGQRYPFRKPPDPRKTASLWATLLADDRPLETTVGFTIADKTQWALEEIYAPKRLFLKQRCHYVQERSASQFCRDFVSRYDEHARKLLTARSRARLKGAREDELPAFPHEKRVAVVPANVASKLSAANTREKVMEVAQKLSIYEIDALPQVLGEEPKLNARLLQYANHVRNVNFQGDSPQWRERFTMWREKQVNAELIAQMQEYCRGRAAAGKPTECLLKRNDLFAGSELVIHPLKSQSKSQKFADGYGGVIAGGGVYANVTWRLTPKPKKVIWYQVKTSSASSLASFAKAVKTYVGHSEASSLGMVRFVTMEDPHED